MMDSKNNFTDFDVEELCRACRDGKYNNAEMLLLRYGKNIVNADCNKGKITPLMYASIAGDKNIVSLLLKYGAHVDVVDSLGNTALIYAVEKNHKVGVIILLRYRADIYSRNRNYNTAMSIARDKGFTSILSTLEEWDSAKVQFFVKAKKININTELHKKRLAVIKKNKSNNPFKK